MSNKFIHNGEFIWSYPALRNNSKKWFIYKCSQCGTLEEKQFRNLDHSLLCHKCKLHLTISNRNGKYHTSKHIKQFIPKKHYISKFPNRCSPLFSTRQIFIYRCYICNKIVESSSKFLQYENRKTLLCQKCRLRESYQLNGTTLDTIKQKRESTMISRYGAKCTSQCDVLKDKTLNTNLIKYGSTCNLHGRNSPSRNPLLSHKYLYNDIYFDSSWELAFYVYFKDHAVHIEREPIYFEYTFNKKNT